ncbi:hypothetical protein BD410DRAFT_805996 [Rickenella mellea]|uniref:Uncharacterized protein n=1 Tax=Rickenella mellea TaxID=50990 RepID=A0A4Y7PVY6_9AGAM|nr:hypothetical protein BD410DRAFT_805996 [Rickenella mellea]
MVDSVKKDKNGNPISGIANLVPSRKFQKYEPHYPNAHPFIFTVGAQTQPSITVNHDVMYRQLLAGPDLGMIGSYYSSAEFTKRVIAEVELTVLLQSSMSLSCSNHQNTHSPFALLAEIWIITCSRSNSELKLAKIIPFSLLRVDHSPRYLTLQQNPRELDAPRIATMGPITLRIATEGGEFKPRNVKYSAELLTSFKSEIPSEIPSAW